MGGIGDFLNSVGHAIGAAQDFADTVNKWTAPGGFQEKPLVSFQGDNGPQVNNPLSTVNPQASDQFGNVPGNPGLEKTMEGMRWLQSNVISHPIATAALVGKMNRGNNSPLGGDYFNSHAWNTAWKAAQHISLAQAFVLSPDEAQKAMDSPLLYYKPPDAYLPPGFKDLDQDHQQQILKDAGLPAVGNRYIEQKRDNSAWFKYGTGALDFSSIMLLDPTALGLGIVGKTVKGANVIKAPKTGWSTQEIDNILSQKKLQTMMDFTWRNKDNSQLLMNTELARRSGMGGAKFANIVSKLQDPDELGLFMRTGMGDGAALEELTARNALIKPRLDGAWRRFDNLGLMRANYEAFPQMQAMIDHQMNTVAQGIQADTAAMGRYNDIIENQGLLDQLHVSRWSIQRAEDRTIAQNQYQAGPAKGIVSGLVRGQSRSATIRPGVGPIQFGNVGVGLGTPAAYTPRVVQSGIIHSRAWGVADFFESPLTVIRSVKNMTPNGWMRIDTLDGPEGRDAINELRGHLARIPGMREEWRQGVLNKYLQTADEHARADILDDVGRIGAAQVARRYGLTPDIGVKLWRKHAALQQAEIGRMRERYTGATDPERVNAAGQPLHLDELPSTGGKLAVTPFTAARLMNGHTLQDLDELGKVLARHGDRLQTLRNAAGGTKDFLEAGAEYTSFLWKFTTLFRLGYIPRVLGDDLASQWASAGTAAMALRGIKGIGNAFDNGARWIAKPALQAREGNALAGAQYAADEMKLLRPQVRRLEGHLAADTAQRAQDVAVATRRHAAAQQRLATLDPADRSPKAMAVRQFANDRAQQLNAAQMRQGAGPSPGKTATLVRLKNQHDRLADYHALSTRAAEDYRAGYQKVVQGSKSVEIDGTQWPAAFEGRSGQYALDQISADSSVGSLFARNKQVIRGNLENSFDHGGVGISASQDPAGHLDAWTHAINNVLTPDLLSNMAIKGKSIEEMTRWMQRDPVGIAYRSRLPKMTPTSEFARSAKYEVDQYMHTPEIRMKALEPGGVTPDWLDKAVPTVADRPDVHTGNIGLSQLSHMNALDRVIAKWYDVAATLPANRLSRHPLFNQFYEGHRDRLAAQLKKQGYGPQQISVDQVERLATNARKLAGRDMRALVFDIAHRSDAAAAMRFMSPFFSATAEAFQRWGRVIADKPQIVGYAANWYNSPAYVGHMQDLDGNKIDDRGYTYLPQWQTNADGTPDYSKKPTIIKRQVPKSERYIITRMPKWFVDSPAGAALNIRESNGGLLLSQNSIDMVTQGDPWFNPGFGPIVQVPVNEWVKDKPSQAELARHLSILPFGVQGGGSFGENPLGRALNIVTPISVKNFLTSYDSSDQRYQQIKSQILNRAIYEHDVLKKPMPSAQEIADRTKQYWKFAAAASFLQPFATQRKDPYQFFYDQYNALRRQNPLTADDEYLKRFGESHFIFASEITKSQGVPPTIAALNAAKKYGSFISKHPDLAPLVIGPEGKGPFSPEAYRYELNNPLVPGGTEMMRGKISADDAVKENQRRLGWAQYTARMNTLNADLRKAGFRSFDEPGAEDFKAQKRGWTQVYANPLKPDGTPNPFFNKAWADDFNSFNPQKYNEIIPGLMELATSPEAKDPRRADLRQLGQYLGGRLQLVAQLNDLKAAGLPATLAAKENEDIRTQWAYFVDGLIEKSPSFGDLYHRYLSRDMGVDAVTEVQNAG